MSKHSFFQAKLFYRIFIALILVFSVVVRSQTTNAIEFEKLGPPFLNYQKLDEVEVGLSSAILQDSSGFIWLVTSEGLHRFDGQEMTLFPGMEQFTSPHVEFISEGQEGRIWIATYDKGIAVFDPKSTQLNVMPLSKYLPQEWQEHEKTPPVGGIVNRNGELFVAIKDRILVLDEKSFTLKKVVETSVAESDLITRLLVTSQGDIWASSYHGSGPMRFDGQAWHHYHYDKEDKNSISSRMVFAFFEDSKQRIWLGTYEGLNLFDPTTETFKRYAPHDLNRSENLIRNIVASIAEDEQGLLWIGFYQGGLYTFDPEKETFFFMPSVKGIETSILSNQFPTYSSSVFIDQQGTLWALTSKGISKLSKQNRQLTQWVNTTKDSCLPRSMYESRHGLFFACDNKLFLKQGDQFSLIKTFADRENNIKIHAQAVADGKDGDIWVATNADGIFKINLNTKSVQHYRFTTEVNNTFAVNLVWYLAFDQQGKLYAMMGQHPELDGGAILIYNENIDDFDIVSTGFKNTHFVDVDDNRLLINRAYTKDKQNLFWFDKRQKTIQPIAVDTGEVIAMVKWDNRIIVATEHLGVMSIDINTGTAEKVITGSENVLLGLYVKQDKLYAASKKHLYQMALDNNVRASLHCVTCTLSIELPVLNHHQHGQLYTSHSFLASTGDFYVFNDNRILSIPVEQRYQPLANDNLMFTEVKAMGQTILPHRKNNHVRLTQSIEQTNSLTILPDTSLLSFKFTKLGTQQPEKIRYAYQLIGLSEEWIATDKGDGIATFSLLPAGDYQLNIRATNELDRWLPDTRTLNIEVLAPWYQSTYAYVIYLLSSLLILFSFSWLYYRKKLAEQEKNNTLALAAAKERVFANLSHEFRTPLTLILGPANVIKKQVEQGVIANNINLIERNAHRLLAMVDQLLQLAKLREQRGEDLTEQHVKTICSSVVSLFATLAKDKSIDLQANIDVDDNVWLTGASDALETILTNLLSNAIKFSYAGGSVVVSTRENKNNVVVTIEDDGCGIADNEVSKIFQRFTRVDSSAVKAPGSGIGLALVHELVQSLKGQIDVQSTVGVGTKFTLELPSIKKEGEASIGQNNSESANEHLALFDDFTETLEGQLDNNLTINSDKPLILIVDDNADIRQFLQDALIDEYQVIQAVDGRQGLQVAAEYSPDLIISDVMMPEMDGFELLNQIRDDMAISHIPVILLTAKGDEQSRLKGLSELADDYVTKPFKPEQLLVRIKNLLGLRVIIRHRFERQFNQPLPFQEKVEAIDKEKKLAEQPLSEKDNQFIEKLQSLYSKLHTDSQLNLAMIADNLAMSERQLQRKLKALLGVTFSESLREHRLTQARYLLAQGEQVAVIADKVGFNSSSYFVRCFKAKYGVTPNEYRKNT